MNSQLTRDIDRQVERARDRAIDEHCGGGLPPECPECGEEMEECENLDDTWTCPECEATVMFGEPDEDSPEGWFYLVPRGDDL